MPLTHIKLISFQGWRLHFIFNLLHTIHRFPHLFNFEILQIVKSNASFVKSRQQQMLYLFALWQKHPEIKHFKWRIPTSCVGSNNSPGLYVVEKREHRLRKSWQAGVAPDTEPRERYRNATILTRIVFWIIWNKVGLREWKSFRTNINGSCTRHAEYTHIRVSDDYHAANFPSFTKTKNEFRWASPRRANKFCVMSSSNCPHAAGLGSEIDTTMYTAANKVDRTDSLIWLLSF